MLISFGHRHHKVISDENVAALSGAWRRMGWATCPFTPRTIARLSEDHGHNRRVARDAATRNWGKVRNEGKPELIHVLDPKHPIAKGVKDFTIPKTEAYLNPFNVPSPDVKILEGRYEGGAQDGSDGMLWNFGKGKVFYFRPGHETYPIYFQAEVQQVLKNAVRFLASR